MRQLLVPPLVVLVLLALATAAATAPSTVVLAVEGMT